MSYEFPPVVLVLALYNHIALETGPCDHQEYGTVHTVVCIHAWGSDKALMKLSEVLHPTSAPFILQVPRQMKIKKYGMTNWKSWTKSWTHNWSLRYLHQHHNQGLALCISHQYCITCTSNNNSHNEWYLTSAFYTVLKNNYVSIYNNTYLWFNILLG
jgi:hypothetical protein